MIKKTASTERGNSRKMERKRDKKNKLKEAIK